MKKSLIYLVICCIGFSSTADAQFLKNLKKKAEDAVERGILKKAGEALTKKPDKETEGETDEESEEDAQAQAIASTAGQPRGGMGMGGNPFFGSGKAPENVPDAYVFDWEFKTKMTIEGKKKKDNGELDMNYFINEGKDYYAIEYEGEELKKSGAKGRMVFDFKSGAMVMLSEYNGQKMGMVNALKDPSKMPIQDKDRNYTFKEVGSKTILGYECHGMQVENKETVATLWFTLDAPVSFSPFFALSSDAAPKGFSDPQLFDILKEEALLMEMEALDKKRKQSMRMTAISLEKKPNTFKTSDYQFMKMGF